MSEFITNAELRIEAERLCDENDQLKAENVKLRELAKEAMKVAHELCGEYSAPCYVCGVDKCGTGCKLDCIDKLARELGIEVDE